MPVPTNAKTIRGTDLWLGKDRWPQMYGFQMHTLAKTIIPNVRNPAFCLLISCSFVNSYSHYMTKYFGATY